MMMRRMLTLIEVLLCARHKEIFISRSTKQIQLVLQLFSVFAHENRFQVEYLCPIILTY